MKRLMKIVRHGSLSTLDEQIPDATGEDESSTQINSEYEAKASGKKIFTNVAKQGSKYVCLSSPTSLVHFLGYPHMAVDAEMAGSPAQSDPELTDHFEDWFSDVNLMLVDDNSGVLAADSGQVLNLDTATGGTSVPSSDA
ncbi:hypothetical protein Taro_024398 [Colocasia esculenta]|uniref:Uncharacterized protein n=1 Tax=Colocasia esculenta TaxID=4460 RepID=A0A843V7C2_COLES|nr:hypothetical protein [Colocasia esculenta]